MVDVRAGPRIAGEHDEAAAGTEERDPAPGGTRCRDDAELMDREQHPRSEAHAGDEAEVTAWPTMNPV